MPFIGDQKEWILRLAEKAAEAKNRERKTGI
jgi:hypothetical protein